MNRLTRALAALSLSIAAHAAHAQGQQQTPAQTPTTQSTPQTSQTPETSQTPQTTQTPQSAEGKAVVIVYRPGKLVGKALEPSVFCDKVEVARMDNDRYFVLLLEPGEHRIHMTQDNKRVDLKLGAGEVAFVRVRVVMGFMKGRGEPSLADEEDAVKDLKKMEPLGADKIKSTTLVVADKAEAEAHLRRFVK
jgi:glucose/arabinose dehydrogenase